MGAKNSIAKTTRNLISLGALSGFCKGFMGIGLGFRTAVFMAIGVRKYTYLATGCLISALVDATRFCIYYFSGTALQVLLWPHVLLAPIFIGVGALWGRYMVGFVSQQLYQTIIMVILLLVGSVLIIRELIVYR